MDTRSERHLLSLPLRPPLDPLFVALPEVLTRYAPQCRGCARSDVSVGVPQKLNESPGYLTVAPLFQHSQRLGRARADSGRGDWCTCPEPRWCCFSGRGYRAAWGWIKGSRQAPSAGPSAVLGEKGPRSRRTRTRRCSGDPDSQALPPAPCSHGPGLGHRESRAWTGGGRIIIGISPAGPAGQEAGGDARRAGSRSPVTRNRGRV